jgi:hypothetical protein
MKTAREITLLLESYLTSFYNKGVSVEVYLNPTEKEMRKLGYDIRFTAISDTKEIYCWSAHGEFHNRSKKLLNIRCPGHEISGHFCDNMLEGVAEKQGRIYVMTRSECFDRLFSAFKSDKDELDNEREALQKILTTNWNWVDKYIEVTGFLKKYRQKLGM